LRRKDLPRLLHMALSVEHEQNRLRVSRKRADKTHSILNSMIPTAPIFPLSEVWSRLFIGLLRQQLWNHVRQWIRCSSRCFSFCVHPAAEDLKTWLKLFFIFVEYVLFLRAMLSWNQLPFSLGRSLFPFDPRGCAVSLIQDKPVRTAALRLKKRENCSEISFSSFEKMHPDRISPSDYGSSEH
jgi:hypothetical protein